MKTFLISSSGMAVIFFAWTFNEIIKKVLNKFVDDFLSFLNWSDLMVLFVIFIIVGINFMYWSVYPEQLAWINSSALLALFLTYIYKLCNTDKALEIKQQRIDKKELQEAEEKLAKQKKIDEEKEIEESNKVVQSFLGDRDKYNINQRVSFNKNMVPFCFVCKQEMYESGVPGSNNTILECGNCPNFFDFTVMGDRRNIRFRNLSEFKKYLKTHVGWFKRFDNKSTN